MPRLLILLPLLACIACCQSAGAMPQGAPAAQPRADRPPRLLTVTGTATVDVQPDILDVRFVQTAESPRPQRAVQELNKARVELVKGILAAGVKPTDLVFATVQLDEIWDYDARPSRITGYRASLVGTATTRDLDRIGEIVEAAAGAGATSIHASTRRSDLPELKKRVRVLALEAAKEKAAISARTLGVTLAEVASVSESPAGGWWAGDGTGVANVVGPSVRLEGQGALAPESGALTLTVTVAYEME
jgi:uncharacterized protein